MRKPVCKLCLVVIVLFVRCQADEEIRIDLERQPDNVELFGEGIISTGMYERDIAISPDGDEIIYTMGDYSHSIGVLVRLVKQDGKWGKRQIVSFSGEYRDIEPFISVLGDKLYFASDRPIYGDTNRNDYNIWVSGKTDSGWAEPSPLNPSINTGGNEYYPSVSKNGNLYFTAVREKGIGGEDIFISRYINGKYVSPQPLDTAINTKSGEFNAYVSPGEDLLIFSSFGRDDDIGRGDLYYSRKDENGKWVKAENMGKGINSERLDYCPFIDVPRGNLYFTSSRKATAPVKIEKIKDLLEYSESAENGMGSIYRLNINMLEY